MSTLYVQVGDRVRSYATLRLGTVVEIRYQLFGVTARVHWDGESVAETEFHDHSTIYPENE